MLHHSRSGKFRATASSGSSKRLDILAELAVRARGAREMKLKRVFTHRTNLESIDAGSTFDGSV